MNGSFGSRLGVDLPKPPLLLLLFLLADLAWSEVADLNDDVETKAAGKRVTVAWEIDAYDVNNKTNGGTGDIIVFVVDMIVR